MSRINYKRVYGAEHARAGAYPGYSLKHYTQRISGLVALHKPRTLLDYGCGKGYQYLVKRLHEKWGGLLPHCYDVGIGAFAKKPEEKFDGVICTDVLEHIHEDDLSEILEDIFSYVRPGGFVFLGISTRSASKKFKYGDMKSQNVHLTVKTAPWWLETVSPYCPKDVQLVIEANDAD